MKRRLSATCAECGASQGCKIANTIPFIQSDWVLGQTLENYSMQAYRCGSQIVVIDDKAEGHCWCEIALSQVDLQVL